jgi:Na+-transporting methylmalonyl-CoA/oxaloacetate decarboxylase gamma subunit
VILHALGQAGELLLIGFFFGLLASLLLGALVYGIGKLEQRAEARYVAAIEKEKERNRAQLRLHEQHRSEMRCYNARPTAGERWAR